MLYFSNPGEIDMRLVQTFGVNVKETSSPIGYFGTGLKYAIAIILRNRGEITIYSGLEGYRFYSRKDTVRGKDFEFVYMSNLSSTEEVQMPFTLELGKNWKPWMAYRELYSNVLDEKGTAEQTYTFPEPGKTLIVVASDVLDTVYRDREAFLLTGQPIWASDNLEVYDAPSSSVFYHGILIGQFDKPGSFTYNLLAQTELSEDRVMAWPFATKRQILRYLQYAPEHIQIDALLGGETTWEYGEDWSNLTWGEPPTAFKAALDALTPTQRRVIPQSIQSLLSKKIPTPAEMTTVEKQMLEKALAFLGLLGYTITQPIIVTHDLPANVLGTVSEKSIVISKLAFERGTKILAGTIMEEHLHISYSFKDCSRSFQDHLVDKIMTLGEQLQNSPVCSRLFQDNLFDDL